MKKSLKELFDDYLAVDVFYGKDDDDHIYLLAPAVRGAETGMEYPFNPTGVCVFYNDGLCDAYDERPYECSAYHHSEKHDGGSSRHKEVAMAWKDHQAQIAELLGRKPCATEPDTFSVLSMMMGGFR